METIKAICSRYSCRAYQSTPVEEDILRDIIAAGSLAAIGRGQFKNVFISVIRDKALLEELDKAGQQVRNNPAYHCFYNAPVLVSVAVKADDNLGKENAACVVENIMIAAADKGVDSIYLHSPCAFLDNDPVMFKKLGAPEGFIPGAFAALGYAAAEKPAERALDCRIETAWI